MSVFPLGREPTARIAGVERLSGRAGRETRKLESVVEEILRRLVRTRAEII